MSQTCLGVCREEEVAYFKAQVREDFLEGCETALAAACGHQAGLLHLAAMGIQSGKTTPTVIVLAPRVN